MNTYMQPTLDIHIEPLPHRCTGWKSLVAATLKFRTAFTFSGKKGTSATDADCIRLDTFRNELLQSAKTQPSVRAWYSAQLVDGTWRGVWADSPQEAAISIAFWWASLLIDVQCDPKYELVR